MPNLSKITKELNLRVCPFCKKPASLMIDDMRKSVIIVCCNPKKCPKGGLTMEKIIWDSTIEESFSQLAEMWNRRELDEQF